jgi:hypothetical protein
MSEEEDKPCGLFGIECKGLSTKNGKKLCTICRQVHPIIFQEMRRVRPYLLPDFEEVEKENDDPRTCVSRRIQFRDEAVMEKVV